MPLKHSTETALVVILAAVIVLTGVVCAILPPITQSSLPWAVAFALSLVYPLSLYPLFKERRADYEFRMLHFVPALMLALWLVLQVVASLLPQLQALLHWYTWGWTLPAVAAAFYALIWFCLHVIRQRVERLWTLVPLFVVFIACSIAGMQYNLPSRVTAMLTGGTSSAASSEHVIAGTQSQSRPSSETMSMGQQVWGMQQRVMQRREKRLAALQGTNNLHGATEGAVIAAGGIPQQIASGSTSSAPPHLPSSGADTEGLLIAAIALYCAVLHERARRRMMA